MNHGLGRFSDCTDCYMDLLVGAYEGPNAIGLELVHDSFPILKFDGYITKNKTDSHLIVLNNMSRNEECKSLDIKMVHSVVLFE